MRFFRPVKTKLYSRQARLNKVVYERSTGKQAIGYNVALDTGGGQFFQSARHERGSQQGFATTKTEAEYLHFN